MSSAAERWLGSLDDATMMDARHVFALSPGYYATTLDALWRKELERRGLTAAWETASRNTIARLPVSHPLDCDWRFTAATAEDLARRAVERLEAGACVAHVGIA